MVSPVNKPRGFFDFLLAIDCETTGLSYNNVDASEGHQPVSWGVIVANAATFEPVESLYLEIKWNEISKAAKAENPKFGESAEKIHGLSFEYLEKNGIEESEAVEKIGNLIVKYWGTDNSIRTLGHNVHLFDVPFMRNMFNRHGIFLKFGNRHYDSNSLALATVGAFNSDDLFETLGFEKRKEHNALDDAKMSLEAFRIVNLLWKAKVGITHTFIPPGE